MKTWTIMVRDLHFHVCICAAKSERVGNWFQNSKLYWRLFLYYCNYLDFCRELFEHIRRVFTEITRDSILFNYSVHVVCIWNSNIYIYIHILILAKGKEFECYKMVSISYYLYTIVGRYDSAVLPNYQTNHLVFYIYF